MASDKAERQTIRKTEAAERKLVSVLFADIVGSSAMVSGCDPEDADEALRAVLTIIEEAVGRYDGTIGQMLGDGVLALFGAPSALEDHALRACLAAQDIRNAAASGSGFSVRVGVASGEVLARVMANGMWTDYRTVGACVHLAAKLQQRAAPNEVLLSYDTVELVPVGLTVQSAGTYQLAANVAPAPIFRLAEVRARRRTATDLVSAEAGPFVGRQRELEVLLAALESACDGVGTLLMVVGEAGIGKSRLVGEALRAAGAAGHALLQWPQAPIRRLGDPDDLERIAATLLAPAGGPERLCDTAVRAAGPLAGAALRDLLGLPVEDRAWQALQPAERLSAAIEALVATMVVLSQNQPILVLVEDVHWAGSVMRRVLNALSGALTGAARILLVATARLENDAGWTPDTEAVRIALEALPPEPTHEFLDRWLGCDPSLSDLKAMVAAKSQGVPLYLEESLRALEAAGTIVGEPGQYRLGGSPTAVQLPASIQALLGARIDSLPADQRRTLRTAAVIGPTFDVGLLRRVDAVAEADLAGRLAALEAAGFIRRSRLIPNLEYSFRHGLIQEVAYGTITRGDRRTLHASIVEALSERRDHDLPGRLDLLAHHAYQAENWPAAYVFGRRAGARAESRSKLEEASQHYRRALTALDNLDGTRRNAMRRIDLSIALPRALLPTGMTGVDEHLNRARDLAAEVGDPMRRARASSLHAAFHWVRGDLDEGIRMSRDGLAALSRRDCQETHVQLLLRLGGILAEKGLLQEAYDTLAEGYALLTAENPFGRYGLAVVAGVAARSGMARCLAQMGNARDGILAGQESIDHAEDSGHLFSKVFAGHHLGWTLLLAGEYRRSIPVLDDALALSDGIRSRLLRPFMLGALGYAWAMLDDAERGLDLLDQSLTTFDRFGQQAQGSQIRIWRAEALIRAGQGNAALAEARLALEAARSRQQLGCEAWASWLLADAAWASAHYDADAAQALSHAHALARRLRMIPLAERCAAAAGRQPNTSKVAWAEVR